MNDILKLLACDGALVFQFSNDGKIEVLCVGTYHGVNLEPFSAASNRVLEAISSMIPNQISITPPGNG